MWTIDGAKLVGLILILLLSSRCTPIYLEKFAQIIQLSKSYFGVDKSYMSVKKVKAFGS